MSVTVAFGIGAPLAVTVPLIVDVVSCATAGVATKAVAANGTKSAAHVRSNTVFFTEKLPRRHCESRWNPATAISRLRQRCYSDWWGVNDSRRPLQICHAVLCVSAHPDGGPSQRTHRPAAGRAPPTAPLWRASGRAEARRSGT